MIEVPFLSYQDLKLRAADVLRSSSCGDQIPVNIELIVERDYDIEIVPIPGLQTAYGIDAFISNDLATITVDESVLENRINRYRFSLAHELGHRVLHQGIFSKIEFASITEWKDFAVSIPAKEYGYLEYQANTFANALLVPQVNLQDEFDKSIELVRQAGLDPYEARDVCLDSISTHLGKTFQVSSTVMSLRIEKDGLFDQL
ncbi:MAG: ImmA/IrrE family metallo-endopeptidase [Pirellulales bacterium]